MPSRLHARIVGRVQGVAYRYSASQVAQRLGLTGWVRNLSDGSVELLAEGPEPSLREMLDWCRLGPSMAQVDQLDEKWSEFSGEFSDFGIRF